MRQLLLSVILLVTGMTFNTNLFAQQVPKNYVVVEIGTGTWCTYCPGAAMGADDLVANGHQVAIIENHNGDSYAYTGSNARNTYYGIDGFPTALFNGQNAVVGGSHTQSMYTTYLPKYNAAIAVMSDFTMELSFTHTGVDYSATINVDEVGDYAGENLVVHLVWTESHIEEEWEGMDELNFVSRGMYPNANGTSYAGGAQEFNIDFTADSSWNILESELVAFIQDNDTKEILQAAKVSLAEPMGTNNALLKDISMENTDVCANPISPVINVLNMGSNAITTMAIDYDINNGATTGTYNWSGNIEFMQEQSISLDPITYDLAEENTFQFTISQVNGGDDDNPDNNQSESVLFLKSANYSPIVIDILTDNYGSETSWTFTDEEGNVLAEGDNYSNNTEYSTNVYVNPDACYTFTINDEYGDGICCGYGNGYYHVSSNGVMIYEGGEFGSQEVRKLKTTEDLTGLEDAVFGKIQIFPNPAHDRFTLINAEGLELNMFDMAGRSILHRTLSSSDETIQLNSLSPGTYFIQLSNGAATHTQKFIIK